jgi:hypothetical protein
VRFSPQFTSFGNKKTPAGAGVFCVVGLGRFTHLQRRKHPAPAGWYGNGCGGGGFCWKSLSNRSAFLSWNQGEYDKTPETSQVKISVEFSIPEDVSPLLAAGLSKSGWMVNL